jgi:hypothetical protein
LFPKTMTSLEKSIEMLAEATTQNLQSNNNLQKNLTSYMQNMSQSIAKIEMKMSQLATSVSEGNEVRYRVNLFQTLGMKTQTQTKLKPFKIAT